FATAADRRDHESELEKLIADWAASRDADAAVDELRANGVPAARIKDVGEGVESDHLAARRYFTELPHPEVARGGLAGAPGSSTRGALHGTSAAPVLGAATDAVLGRLVGLDPAAIARLRDDGVIG